MFFHSLGVQLFSEVLSGPFANSKQAPGDHNFTTPSLPPVPVAVAQFPPEKDKEMPRVLLTQLTWANFVFVWTILQRHFLIPGIGEQGVDGSRSL